MALEKASDPRESRRENARKPPKTSFWQSVAQKEMLWEFLTSN